MLKSVKKRLRSRIRRRKHTLAFLKVGSSEILLSGYRYQVSISCSALLSSEHLELGCPSVGLRNAGSSPGGPGT